MSNSENMIDEEINQFLEDNLHDDTLRAATPNSSGRKSVSVDLVGDAALHKKWIDACENAWSKATEMFKIAKKTEKSRDTIFDQLSKSIDDLITLSDDRVKTALNLATHLPDIEILNECFRKGLNTPADLKNKLADRSRCRDALAKIADSLDCLLDDVIDNPEEVINYVSITKDIRSALDVSVSDVVDGVLDLQAANRLAKKAKNEFDRRHDKMLEEMGVLKAKIASLEAGNNDPLQADRREKQSETKKALVTIEKGMSSASDDSDDEQIQASAPCSSHRRMRAKKLKDTVTSIKQMQRNKSPTSECSTTSMRTGEPALSALLSNQIKLTQMQFLPKLAKFSGESSKSLADYVSSFNRRFPSELFDDETRAEFLIEQLDGKALSYLNTFPNDTKRSFNRIVHKLTEKLKSSATINSMAAIEKLARLTYKGKTADELDKFCSKVESLSRQAHPHMDEENLSVEKAAVLLRQFQGKPYELRELNYRMETAEKGQEFRTIRELAMSHARVKDRFVGMDEESTSYAKRKGEFRSSKAAGPSKGNGTAEISESTEKAESPNRNSDRPRFDKNKSYCFVCREKGHMARACPNREKEERPLKNQKNSSGATSETKSKDRVGALSIRQAPVINSINLVKQIVVPRFGQRSEKPVIVLGKQFQALIDTGAQITTMSTDVLVDAEKRDVDVAALVKDIDPSILAKDPKLVSYCNSELKFAKVATLEIELVENRAKAMVPVYFDEKTSGEVLLGTNALKALGVKLVVENADSNGRVCGTAEDELEKEVLSIHEQILVATVQKRVVIEPGHMKTVSVSAPRCSTDDTPVLWAKEEDNRISSGVHRVESGYADVSVSNLTDSSLVFQSGDVLGTWDTNCKVHKVDSCRFNELQLLDQHGTQGSWSSSKDRTNQLLRTLEEVRKAKAVSKLPDEIKRVLVDYADVFALEDCELTQNDVVALDIDTGNAEPIRQKARRVPYGARAQLKEILTGLLEKGVITPSSSEWASPIVLVEKKDKTLRLCVDYRELNKVMRHDAYPLPVIDQILQSLAGKSCFSTLDLHSGFWQLPLSKNAQPKSAFTTSEGLFEFKVVPFGLSTSPAVFQRTMETILKEVDGYGSEVIVYVDDILIATSDEERHVIVLEKVLNCFRKANLKLKAQKCKILLNQVEYLGHVVNCEGVQTDPDKVESINSFPIPTNVTELRRFLGLCNYYRKFVLRYGALAKPLNELTGKKDWKWTESCDIAFTKLKDALSRAPVLGQPNVEAASTGERPLIIYTDASRVGVGAVLCQEGNDGFLHPLYFASKSLSKAQKNYSITDLEALAVVFACEKFHYFIFGMKVIVRSDHQPLLALFKRTDVSPRVMRWAIQLMTYSGLSMEYVKGKVNVVADALSRGLKITPCHEGVSETDEKVIAALRCSDDVSEWLRELKQDSDYAKLIDNVENGHLEEKIRLPKVSKSLYSRDFKINDGFLCYIDTDGSYKKVVPKSKRKALFLEQHGKGHFSSGKVAKMLQKELFWNGLLSDVAAWHKECVACYVNNVKPVIPPLQPILTSKPYELVAIDLMDLGVTENGNRYVVTIIDHFSKFTNAFPVRDKSAKTVSECIVHQWMCQGARWPRQFLSDQGSEFINSVVEEIVSLTGCKWITTKGYNSRENGAVERVQRTLQNALKKCVDSPTKWDMVLPFVVYAYNTTCHESTGESPYFLLHGSDPPLISEIAPPRELTLALVDSDDYRAHLIESVRIARDFACSRNAREAEHMKKHYDERRRATKEKLPQAGGRVFVFMPQEKSNAKNPKLVQEFRGPYRVLESSDTSALVTLIAGNEEPIRIQHDFLLKVPECMEDVILETKTKRKSKTKRRKLAKIKSTENVVRVNCIQGVRFATPDRNPTDSGNVPDLLKNCRSSSDSQNSENTDVARYRFARSLLDGNDCVQCSMGEQLFGNIWSLMPSAPVIPPVLSKKKVFNIRMLSRLTTIAMVDWPLSKKIAALALPLESVEPSAEGIAAAWFLASASCEHVATLVPKMRNQKVIFDDSSAMVGDSSIGAVEAAWEMLPTIEQFFVEKNESKKTVEVEARGSVILMPPEFNIQNGNIKWKNRTLPMTYGSLDYLGDLTNRKFKPQMDKLVVIPPIRPPTGGQSIDCKSLADFAEQGGARQVLLVPPVYTDEGWNRWRKLLAAEVKKQNDRLTYLGKQVEFRFEDCKEEIPSVLSPYGCAGVDPLRGSNSMPGVVVERFFQLLAKDFPFLGVFVNRKRSHGPDDSQEVRCMRLVHSRMPKTGDRGVLFVGTTKLEGGACQKTSEFEQLHEWFQGIAEGDMEWS